MLRTLALLCLFVAAQAHAGTCEGTFTDGTRPVCSQTFQMYQTCPTGDLVWSWTISGYPGTWQIRPWLDRDINIVGVELVDTTPGDGHLWMMVGNNSQGDPMLYLGAGEQHVKTFYPPGLSWAFPSRAKAVATDYIDLHGSCKAGAWTTVMLTFYYTISPQ